MKRFFTLLIIAAILMCGCSSLCGCSPLSGFSKNDNMPQIVCSLFPVYDIVDQIAGDVLSVSILAASGTDGHSYEPTAADIKAVIDCELFIYIGGQGEVWAELLLESLKNDVPQTLNMLERMQDSLITEDHHEDHHDEDILHDSGELYDEHIWTSPRIYQEMVNVICAALCEIFPDNAEHFKAKAEDYCAKISLLDEKMREISANAVTHTLVFADKFPFKYLAQEYGFDYIAAFDGCGEDTEPSAGAVAEIIKFVKSNGIPVIFCLSDSSVKIAQTIANDTGAEILTLHSCHTLTSKERKNKETYISLMSGNIEKIRYAVCGE